MNVYLDDLAQLPKFGILIPSSQTKQHHQLSIISNCRLGTYILQLPTITSVLIGNNDIHIDCK